MQRVKYQQKTTSNGNEEKPREEQRERRYNNNNYNNSYKKTRYHDRQDRYVNKFGFDYDENKIGYNTQIPQMPQKLKSKPEDTKFNKKVQQLQTKATELKAQRKQKKNIYKNGNKGFKEQIQKEKKKIALAKACLVVLNFDKQELQGKLSNVQSKIVSNKKKTDSLNRPSQKIGKKNIEEMNFAELALQQERIEHSMSTLKLSKAQQVEFSNKINKIKKRRLQVPKESLENKDKSKLGEISDLQNQIVRLKTIRDTLKDKIKDIESKIQSIQDDISQFQQNIEQIHQKQRNTDNAALLQQTAQLKKKIHALWAEIDILKKEHDAKIHDYQYQQEKIKYINWAKQIKSKKIEQWELQKQQRKKQKLREKQRQKKGTKAQQNKQKPKQGQTPEQKPAYERKKINRNQKEIDSCAFLIQYCKDLNSTSLNNKKSNVQNEVKLQDALKKGQWAKMKNVQVIQPKKKNVDEEPVQSKNYKKKQNKNPVVEPTDRFSHTYFVAQIFDSVKVLPPGKQQDLQKIINELQDKMQYYIAHPDEGVDKPLIVQGRQSQRDTKTKRRIINTEQFPSLK